MSLSIELDLPFADDLSGKVPDVPEKDLLTNQQQVKESVAYLLNQANANNNSTQVAPPILLNKTISSASMESLSSAEAVTASTFQRKIYGCSIDLSTDELPEDLI